MKAINDVDKQVIEIQANYYEAHFLTEALHYYQLAIQRNAVDFNDEEYIYHLADSIRNSSVKKGNKLYER